MAIRAKQRLVTDAQPDQMRLARMARGSPWPGKNIKRSAFNLVQQGAGGDLGSALERAYNRLALVQAERAQAEVAAQLVEGWT